MTSETRRPYEYENNKAVLTSRSKREGGKKGLIGLGVSGRLGCGGLGGLQPREFGRIYGGSWG